MEKHWKIFQQIHNQNNCAFYKILMSPRVINNGRRQSLWFIKRLRTHVRDFHGERQFTHLINGRSNRWCRKTEPSAEVSIYLWGKSTLKLKLRTDTVKNNERKWRDKGWAKKNKGTERERGHISKHRKPSRDWRFKRIKTNIHVYVIKKRIGLLRKEKMKGECEPGVDYQRKLRDVWKRSISVCYEIEGKAWWNQQGKKEKRNGTDDGNDGPP